MVRVVAKTKPDKVDAGIGKLRGDGKKKMYRLLYIILSGFIGSLAAALVKLGLGSIASESVSGFFQIVTFLVAFYYTNKCLTILRQ